MLLIFNIAVIEFSRQIEIKIVETEVLDPYPCFSGRKFHR